MRCEARLTRMVMVPETRSLPAAPPRGWTATRFFALPEGEHYQLVEGEILVTPPPSTFHQRLSMRSRLILGAHVEKHALGEVFAAPIAVVLSKRTVLEPDLLFVSAKRASIVQRPGIVGAPDLVVEILSPGTARLDRTRKLRLNATHGVTHYWILDPEESTLEALALKGEKYTLEEALDGSATFKPALFPGLSIDLTRLFG